ncbi:oligosaccharide flippase family protein [Pseudoalteromonas luteoviolacea]|uniref:oligosaccharide flippase family protein n=1 Tax=Pseudoalteromonas luteoviolacea TaxID=43657 RepID=UPI001B37EA1C|nr:oligosaccharide flippase family protein [Pseudoalteromonas luteoviolacea]MBQ4812046.1 oligosaccharide flippase family protein [Pseudoalteromonas luteoviolacea]
MKRNPSLKVNILANYTSQLYVTGLGILILPLYIKYMGGEAYGLVGFFAMLQAWFNLLDLGLTPTLARETARYHGGDASALSFRRLLRSLSVIFVISAFIGGGGLWFFADTIALSWLNVKTLEIEEVIFAIQIMAVAVAMRWVSGIYRGIITGSERLAWLSAFNACIASLKFLGVFLSMSLFGYTPSVFFLHQLAIAAIELIILYAMGERIAPDKKLIKEPIGWSIRPVRSVLKFSLTIAFTSSVWVFVTQSDKLVLSGILGLKEYGFFTLSVLAASSILILSGPISQSIMPRMSRLYAEKSLEEMLRVYRDGTKLVVIIAGSAAFVLAFFSKDILLIWTGDELLSEHASKILTLYSIGNLFLILSAFPYYLQYAKGKLRYHLYSNIVMIVLLIPLIIFFAREYGAIGAGWVWMTINAFFLFFWATFIHYKLSPSIAKKWLFKDVLALLIPEFCIVILLSNYFDLSAYDGVYKLAYIVFSFLVVVLVALLINIKTRVFLFNKFRGLLYS